MNAQTRTSLVIGLVVTVAIGVFLYLAPGSDKDTAAPEASKSPVEASVLVREDSHVLGEQGSSEVTLVEFLDYQCPSCGTMHPVIQELQEKYEGRVTFVLRQFPLEMHANARSAALAAEAAARQQKLVEMTDALFDGQSEWSELDTTAAAAHFRGLAEELDLDLEQYDEDLTDPALTARIERDLADGTALGVRGTPTLFLDGKQLEISRYSDVAAAIDQALGSGIAA